MKENHFLSDENIMYSSLTYSKLKECIDVFFYRFNENLSYE